MSRKFPLRPLLARLCGVALLALALVGALPGAARAAGVSITTFYTTTKAAYDAYNVNNPSPPTRTSNFPHGTVDIAFYFEYQGAVAKSSTFQLVIYDGKGNAYFTGKTHLFPYNDGSELRDVGGGDPYGDGTYRVDLVVGGSVASSASFSVGAQRIGIQKARLITKAAWDAYDPNAGKDPPAVTSFLASATRIGFYFAFTGARPKSDTFQLVLAGDGGSQIGKGKVHPFPYVDGSDALLVPLNDGVHLSAGGNYHADLLVNGSLAQRLPWTVTGAGSAPPVPPTGNPVAGTPQSPKVCNAKELADVVDCAEPSVLRLVVEVSGGESAGTGFVIRVDNTGTYVLTNKHVVEGGSASGTIAYGPDGKTKYPVQAILSNTGKTGTAGDMAIVRLAPGLGLRPLAWANSGTLRVGQSVASIGYGLAFDLAGPPSVTQGIVSALGRDLGDGYGPVWIQHQSTINHGNSGGPLLDLKGNVVGVNTLSIDQLPSQSGSGSEPVQGVFFAIPGNYAQQVAAKLIAALQGGGNEDLQGQTLTSQPYQGKGFSLSLPLSWSVNKLGADPLFISRDQLVEVVVRTLTSSSPISQGEAKTLVTKLAKSVGTIQSISYTPVTVGQLNGVQASATFKGRATHWDFYVLADATGTHAYAIARTRAVGATAQDVQQGEQVLNSLRATR